MTIKLPGKAKKQFGRPPYEDLKSMGADNFAAMEKKLMAGETPGAVARWIQEDLGLLTTKKRTTLEVQVRRYSQKELRGKAIQKIAMLQGKKSTQFLMERLHALEEMESLFLVQKSRMEKIVGHEKNLAPGLLLKDASAEIRLTKDMLVDLGRLQMELGVIKKLDTGPNAPKLNEDGTIQEFSWSDEQEAMFREISGMLEDAEA